MTQQLERRLVNEYAREKLSDKHYQTRVWLGPLPPGKEAAEYQVVGRWADLIIFEPMVITIVEAKLSPDPKGIGQLELYADLFRKTQRFSRYWPLLIKKVYLTTRVDEHILGVGKEHGIEYEVFRPDWVEYWEKRKFRL